MQLITAFAASALLFTGALAQKQSKPFYLELKSDNSSLNGHVLDAGHEGAAIEGLLLGPKASAVPKKTANYYTFNFNYTRSLPNDGQLVWNLEGGSGNDSFSESEAMTLYLDPSTNVALALFYPTNEPQSLSFDHDNNMYIQSYLNDRVNPPQSGNRTNLYNWYMCESNYEGYIYNTLNWVYGTKYGPQNPSCQAVNVTRTFTKSS